MHPIAVGFMMHITRSPGIFRLPFFLACLYANLTISYHHETHEIGGNGLASMAANMLHECDRFCALGMLHHWMTHLIPTILNPTIVWYSFWSQRCLALSLTAWFLRGCFTKDSTCACCTERPLPGWILSNRIGSGGPSGAMELIRGKLCQARNSALPCETIVKRMKPWFGAQRNHGGWRYFEMF